MVKFAWVKVASVKSARDKFASVKFAPNKRASDKSALNNIASDKLELVKMRQGRYDLLKNGETYSESITSEMNSREEIITRLISTGLRHGTDVKFLVEQLNKAEGDITSFGKAISRK